MSTATSTGPRLRPPLLNVPNQLTGSRFVLAIGLFILISWEQWLWSAAVFVVAALTDWLDGYLARRQGITSTLGRNLDPLVDKILTCGAFIFLLPFGQEQTGLLPWMVVVIVTRELLVTSLRSFMETHGARFGADWPGKFKMVLQCAALLLILLVLAWQSVDWLAWTSVVRDVLIYAMLVSTLLSGLQYLWRASTVLRNID